MLVIVIESAPPRLRGYLSRWLLEIRAGVYLGDYSVRVREKLWKVVSDEIKEGNAVMAWATNNESGYSFVTTGQNCREPVDWEGFSLVRFVPDSARSAS